MREMTSAEGVSVFYRFFSAQMEAQKILQLRFRKAGRVWCYAARETDRARDTIESSFYRSK